MREYMRHRGAARSAISALLALHARGVAFGIAVLDAQVLAEGPALDFETLFEGLDASLGLRIACEAHQRPDGAHANRLLRIRRERLGSQCAAEQPDQLAPSHGELTPRPRSRDTIAVVERVEGVHCIKKLGPLAAPSVKREAEENWGRKKWR